MEPLHACNQEATTQERNHIQYTPNAAMLARAIIACATSDRCGAACKPGAKASAVAEVKGYRHTRWASQLWRKAACACSHYPRSAWQRLEVRRVVPRTANATDWGPACPRACETAVSRAWSRVAKLHEAALMERRDPL